MANDPRSFAQKAAEQYAAAQGMTPNQISQYNHKLYQQVLVPASELFEEQYRQRTEWMWAGVRCTVEEFAERAYGDTAEATAFLLRYKSV